ncbi:hypothetical protein BGZ72_003274 [Mortierella alpina]|nr:hypothetical protein BGZ72_003274 [Mortierella alpina]
MTTASSPIASLADLAKERPSTNMKQHAEYAERLEPRSISMDYTPSNNNSTSNSAVVNGSPYTVRHQQQGHYGQEHPGGYTDSYYDKAQQQPPQHHYNTSNHSHHSSSSSSSSHVPHSSAYLPPPIQTVPVAGHGNGNSGHDSSLYGGSHHGHAQSAHGSFMPPTIPPTSTPPLSSNSTHSVHQSQQQGHYDYEHSQPQYHQYHAHHPSYPQEHNPHPLSPSSEGNGHHLYGSHPIPTGKTDNGNNISNGSYSSSASSSHYSRNHPYSSSAQSYSNNNSSSNGHSGYGIDGQPESPGTGLGIGPEGMMGNGHSHGKGDHGSMVYSSSAPSPSTRPKRRSEVFAHQESPYFYPAQQHFNLFSADQSMSYNIKIAAKIDRGFFLAANDWTCYRRNYFQLSASFSILGLDTAIHPEVPCLLERSGELLPVRAFLICIGARIQNGEKVIELVQHTPKRDKGPQITPQPTHVRAGGDLSINSSGSNPNVITFERVQFKTATANNGKRRAAQQYYQVHVDLFAELDNGELILVADAFSAPLVVRGRSPGHYADTDDVPVDASAPHGMEARYHYRNDSISSGGGGPLGSPISPSEYPYYSGYTYGSSYPYQSLGSASHVATHTHDAAYYDRKNSDSYPASPLSPSAVPHPGESVSPDMYSPAGFVGPDSPSTFSRLPQMAGHPQSHYNSTYAQYYAAQQHHEMYRDQDHETQMAGLRIHSPTSPKPPNSSATASPIPTPRRQSFSSTLISKKTERVVGGSTTRKSRSISLSGTMSTTTVIKHASSKARSVRTVPATPTNDMPRGHQGYSDRIPEEDQHLM